MMTKYKGYDIYHYHSQWDSETWFRKPGDERQDAEGVVDARRQIDALEGTPAEEPEPETVTVKYKGQPYGINRRETQQKRLYTAENDAFGGLKDDLGDRSLREAQRYADRVTKSATWKRLRASHGHSGSGKVPKVTIERAPKGSNATAYPGQWRIRVPESMTNEHVMLHELAHILVGPSIGHHWPFCRAFADLVSVFMGKEAKKKLHAAYRKHGVKASPPRVMTAEQKAELSARGMAALTAWKAQVASKAAKPSEKEPS